ncbi:MAG: glycogen debranching N-terminal domain-containing protein [Candidatus Limnocylindria bacterium]
MPVKISVGPPVITIHDNSTFMVSDSSAEITGDDELGVFADDTRFVSITRSSPTVCPGYR